MKTSSLIAKFTNVDHNRTKNINPTSPIWSWTTLF